MYYYIIFQFSIFNTDNGSVSNSRFKSSISCASVNGVALKGSNILFSVAWPGSNLILLNTDSWTFIIKSFAGGQTFDSWLYDSLSGR